MNSSDRHPDLLTGTEAAAYLRLTDVAPSPESALGTLHRLARRGEIHPIAWAKEHLFHRHDLDAFVASELQRLRASDQATECDRGSGRTIAENRVNGHFAGHPEGANQ